MTIPSNLRTLALLSAMAMAGLWTHPAQAAILLSSLWSPAASLMVTASVLQQGQLTSMPMLAQQKILGGQVATFSGSCKNQTDTCSIQRAMRDNDCRSLRKRCVASNPDNVLGCTNRQTSCLDQSAAVFASCQDRQVSDTACWLFEPTAERECLGFKVRSCTVNGQTGTKQATDCNTTTGEWNWGDCTIPTVTVGTAGVGGGSLCTGSTVRSCRMTDGTPGMQVSVGMCDPATRDWVWGACQAASCKGSSVRTCLMPLSEKCQLLANRPQNEAIAGLTVVKECTPVFGTETAKTCDPVSGLWTGWGTCSPDLQTVETHWNVTSTVKVVNWPKIQNVYVVNEPASSVTANPVPTAAPVTVTNPITPVTITPVIPVVPTIPIVVTPSTPISPVIPITPTVPIVVSPVTPSTPPITTPTVPIVVSPVTPSTPPITTPTVPIVVSPVKNSPAAPNSAFQVVTTPTPTTPRTSGTTAPAAGTTTPTRVGSVGSGTRILW